MNLYYKPTCYYSKKVIKAAAALGIPLQLLDINSNLELAEQLIKKGGKRQVPFLVDPKNNVAMYESSDIIKYLEKNYVH